MKDSESELLNAIVHNFSAFLRVRSFQSLSLLGAKSLAQSLGLVNFYFGRSTFSKLCTPTSCCIVYLAHLQFACLI